MILPTNDDALKVLSDDPKEREHQIYQPNKMCVSVWYEGEQTTWYIGFFTSIKDDQTFVVEQLVRVERGADLMWVHPSSPILEEVTSDQVLRYKNGKLLEVKGSWNYERKNKFTLKNKDEIKKEFESFKMVDD